METQQAISRARLARKVGREIEVMVDRIEGRRVIARSHADAPEIDGAVYLRGATGLAPGTRCQVRVTRSDDYDLHATVKR